MCNISIPPFFGVWKRALSSGLGEAASPQNRSMIPGRMRSAGWMLTLIAGFAAASGMIHGQTSIGTAAVGSATSATTVTLTVSRAGTVSRVEVLTMGSPNLDFAASGSGTCSGSLAVNQTCTKDVTFTPAVAGKRMGAVVLLDSSNNVLSTAYIYGMGQGGLGVLVPGNITPVAGTYRSWVSTKDNIPATQADLDQPSSIVFDGNGDMFIADSAHDKIRVVAAPVAPATVGIINTYAGTGVSGYSGDGGSATSALLNTPSGVALDGAGNLYVADTGNNVIRKITPQGIISTIAGNGTAGYQGNNQSNPALMEFNAPQTVTVDAAGNLYIADTGNQVVRKLTASTGVLTTIAGNGAASGNGDGKGTYSGDNGLATAAGLNLPYAVAFDPSGNMYIADSGNNRIRKVDTAGIITTYAGNGTPGYSGDKYLATAAHLNTPSGVATDAAGNVYIADTQNGAIRKVNSSTGIIISIALTNAGYVLNSSGSPVPAQIYAPIGIAVDGKGNVYFADYYYMWIEDIQSNLAILDYLGTPTRQGDVSASQPQTVENDGNLPLTIVSITPDANAQVASTTCSLSSQLAVNSDCTINAEFAPTVSGNPLVANIDVDGQTVNSPLDIELIGDATPVNSTTVTLTSSLNPSNYGNSVTFTATVTTGANTGALTGTVTFYDGSTVLQSNATLTSGVATYSIPSLTVGTHSITAAYSGDSGHFASTSTAVSQVVREATSTALSSSSNPSALGGSVTFTATVSAPGGGGITPDGTILFSDGTTPLATVNLNTAGVATFTTSTLSDGAHSITATYSGDANNYILGSVSSALTQDVQAASQVTVASSGSPSNFGSPVTFTASVVSGSTLAPTGTVNILDGGKKIGSATIVGTSGTAAFTTASLSAGSHAITAAYLGDANAGPATSSPIIQQVNLAQTATGISAAPSPGIAGKAVVITATVTITAGSGPPTGTVTFKDGATALGSAAVGANGVANFSTILAPGAHALTASYGGDANDSSSTSTPLAFAVVLADTAVKVTSSGSPAYVLSTVTFTATVTSNGGIPTGTVSFLVDGANAGSATLSASGTATFADSSLAVGSHTISATYAGDASDHGSSSTGISQVIQAIPTTTGLGQSTTGGATPQVVLVATVLGASGPMPSGVVTFKDGSSIIGAATVDATGVATLTPDLSPGNHSIVASYAGDTIHAPSDSPALSVSSIPVNFAVGVSPGSVSIPTKQNITLNVTFTSASGFTDTIGMGCLSLPAAVNCHFSADTITLKPGAQQTVQVTIDTNNPLSGGQSASAQRPGTNSAQLAGLFLPPGLLFGWFAWRFRRRHTAWLTVICLLFLAGACAVTGCGGYSQSSAAPGSYTIQIGGVGTSSNISHYQSVPLTITK